MPELPEVETVVRDLRDRLTGRVIVGVWFDWPKMIKDPLNQSRLHISESAVTKFQKDIIGEKIIGARRKGKNILIDLTRDKLLLVHQKMTGHFLIGKWEIVGGRAVALEPREIIEDSYNGYVHLILYLDNGQMLGLSDVRKFAKVLLGPCEQIESLPELAELGPDALDPKLTEEIFADIITHEHRPIKQVLMDPYVLAGIGNIYSDDILWRAHVHPSRPANKLKTDELSAIYEAMRAVLSKAVELRGTSTSDFRDPSGKEGGYTGHRLVYQREDEPCQRCATPIKRITVGGRSAHFCPKCQTHNGKKS